MSALVSLSAETLARIIAAAGAPPIFLDRLPWTEVGAYRECNGGLLLLPLGATEQHGPHLPICTDTLIASAACAFASAKTGVPVLPPLAYTVSAGHTAKWPARSRCSMRRFSPRCASSRHGAPRLAGSDCSS